MSTPYLVKKLPPKPGPTSTLYVQKWRNHFFRCIIFLGVVSRPNPANIDLVGPLLNAALSNRIETRLRTSCDKCFCCQVYCECT